MGQMRGLLLVALGVFVLFLVVSGRAKRVPAAWGYLVDGAWADGAAGTPSAGGSAWDNFLSGLTGGLPKLPDLGGILKPTQPTVPSGTGGGKGTSTGRTPDSPAQVAESRRKLCAQFPIPGYC